MTGGAPGREPEPDDQEQSVLHGIGSLCRVERAWRTTTPTGEPERDRHRATTSALTAAWHRHQSASPGPLMLAWTRPCPGAPISILCTTTAAGSGNPPPLHFPPGTAGRPINGHQAAAELAAIGWWVPLAATVDVLPDLSPSTTSGAAAPIPLEEVLLGAWPGAFAWLVLAEPIPAAELTATADTLAEDERDARTRGNSPAYTLRAERLAIRHRQARNAAPGMWRVRLLAGGQDPDAAATVAGLYIAGCDLDGTTYTLAPTAPVDGLHTALRAATPVDGPQIPFTAGSAELARLAALPVGEIPGFRYAERPRFDVNPGPATADGLPPITLGDILDNDDEPCGPLHISRSSLNRHAFICGATGSGKTQTVKALLEELARTSSPVPWLVIEPAKAEYARMSGRLHDVADVLVIRPGDPDAIPACLNPLEPGPGTPLQTHIDLVRALFLASFEAVEPFPQVLAHALTRCYIDAGWDIALSEPRHPAVGARWPTLGDLRTAALEVVGGIGYGREVTDNVRGFIDVRISSLRLGATGRFFENGHRLDIGQLLARNAVLEIEDVGNDQDKAFLIGTVLIRLAEHLRRAAPAGPTRLRHITVVEEAHRLLRHADPGSPAAHAVEMFAGLLAEVRAYGEGIVVAEQIPAKIIPDVVKNSAVKIMHRLPARDDRDAVGATMNLTDDQSRNVVALPAGTAAMSADGFDAPVRIRVPLGEDREDASGATALPPVRPRFDLCGADCAARPCTLREITSAGRLADDPRLILWIELLTVAHLVGEPEPRPDPAWLDSLRRGVADRTLRCAIVERIQGAVDARWTGLAAHYRPAELAAHLAVAATRRLDGAIEPGPCDGTEVRWQAGRHRWIDVYRSLSDTADTTVPHPDTALWRERGLHLEGRDATEQLEAYRRHPDVHLPPRTTITGTGAPPAHERAAAALHHDPDPANRLRSTVGHLHLNSMWPVTRLYPQSAETMPARGAIR